MIVDRNRNALRAVANLLLLKNAAGASIPAKGAVPCLLALLALATWIGIDWLRNQPDPAFYPYGLPALAWYAVGLYAMASLLGGLSNPQAEAGRVLTLLLAVTPIALAGLFLIESRPFHPGTIQAATSFLCLYLFVYLGKGLRALTGRWQLRALAVGVVLTAGFLWTTGQLLVDPTVWYSQDEEDDDEADADLTESLLFSQPGRIDEAVARMAPSRPGRPNAYFVGFAGYGEQRVFAEEIGLAARTVGRRFGSQNRSLLLANDRRSRQEAPLASPTALHYALKTVAARMNLEQDVLFLSISSHGSEDGSVSVSNGSLPLHDLTASELASALNEAGFRWRVIVISACYSGSFIEPLLAPGTAVITAAAADRTSFGCADDRDLTYFSEAFYRDSLPQARSLEEAFEKARATITEREKREGVEASRPQAYFGPGIEEQVAKLGAMTGAIGANRVRTHD